MTVPDRSAMPARLVLAGVLVATLGATATAPPRGSAPPLVAHLAAAHRGGINVEPSMRPWQYLGPNPDSWWCTAPNCVNNADPSYTVNNELDLAAALGVANVRVEMPWYLIEPQRGVYDWRRADGIIEAASAHRVTIQPVLVYTPQWDGGYNAFPPPADFQAFVTAFVRRYGSVISDVEMWNEPDGGQSLAANDPTRYVQDILAPGYAAVKSVNPAIQVIEGGSINDSGNGGSPWLNGIYAAGGGGDFNIAAFHDYGGNYSIVTNQYQAVLNAHGQGGKPIWMGEYGTSESSAIDPSQQSLIDGALTTPGLALSQLYTLRDESVYQCCPVRGTGENQSYGIVFHDGRAPKAGFAHLQQQLGGSGGFPGPPSGYPPIDSSFPSYTGTEGYWLVAADGGIFPFGRVAGYGSTGAMHLNRPIVGMAPTADRHGYWLVAADGGIFPFGDAGGYGSTGGMHLNQPIVGMAATPTGHGYWLVAADGGVFPFGDAAGYGSTGGIHLNRPIVGVAAVPAGGCGAAVCGYWLVASDGGVFPFGPGATGWGSTGGIHLNRPIVGMAASLHGGYWLVASDGGVFPFGPGAPGYGSTGGMHLNLPIVGMSVTTDGGGYWLVAADGGIFPFRDADGIGSTAGYPLNQPVVGMATGA